MNLKLLVNNSHVLLEPQCSEENQNSNQSAKMAARDSSVLISEEQLEELSENFDTVSIYFFKQMKITVIVFM